MFRPLKLDGLASAGAVEVVVDPAAPLIAIPDADEVTRFDVEPEDESSSRRLGLCGPPRFAVSLFRPI